MEQAQHDTPLWRVRGGNEQRKYVGSGTEPEFGGGRLSCLHERVKAGRNSWWRASGQAQVCEVTPYPLFLI